MRDIINQYFERFDFDIRQTKDARFADQKCTPDVVCFIADCIENSNLSESFTVKDIWDSTYFINNTMAVFGKPIPTDITARSEYDKFIQQPLRLLAYAGILGIEKKSGTNHYNIKSSDILEYISLKERNAYNFLYCYFLKVLKDSRIYRYFETYINKGKSRALSNEDFKELQLHYKKFIIGQTKINGETEIRRIFPKILNIIAVENNIQGSAKGKLSKFPFTFSDLMYNTKNWRDLNKEKSVSRQKAKENVKSLKNQQDVYSKYCIQRAMNVLRKIQIESEVHDKWDDSAATQIHHIFPKHEFPQIAHYIENLIKLTPTQHFAKAHPNNRTQSINKDYQLTCLLSKADTIEKSLKKDGEKYYRKESFINVINVGLNYRMDTSVTFSDIIITLNKIYNNVA